MTVALWCSLKSESLILPALFFFLKIALALWAFVSKKKKKRERERDCFVLVLGKMTLVI